MTAASGSLDRPLIAHVVYRFDVGGLENGVVNLINRLPADRYRHAVVSLTEVTDFRRRIVRDDVVYVALHKPPGQGLWQLPRWRQAFRELQPAIVHTRNIGALEASLAALFAGVPARIHGEHGWDSADPDGSNWKHRLTRRAYRLSVDHWVALSSHIEGYLRDVIGVRAARLSRICNGVDTQRFHPRDGERQPISGSPFNDPALFVVGTVGRLQAVKDQCTLVHGFARAVQASPSARKRMRLVIAGDGELREEVEAAIAAHGLQGKIWLAGQRDDVPAILAGLDVFVLPSLAEGISNTILESMACGLPIVATRVGGTPELITDGRTGILVSTANPEALGQALVRLLGQPADCQRLGLNARADCERRFSLDRMVADYAALYDQLLAGARVRTLAVAGTAR
jgi:sugar transferase (PEP-CTERM/EpsH1 system associated)